MRDDRLRILDIDEAIERIEKYATDKSAFDNDELVQSWVVRHIHIIGEAANKLSPAMQEAHPEIPWSDIIGMRNILVHDYFNINLDIVWRVVERDLPYLKLKIKAIVDSLED